MKRPVALVILDGWGINENTQDNAVSQAPCTSGRARLRQAAASRGWAARITPWFPVPK